MTGESTLDEIKSVWQHWKGDTHRWRSSHAMVKISTILDETEKEAVKA